MKELEPGIEERRKKTGPYEREANDEYLHKRRRWLRANSAAMSWLYDQGLTDKTIEDYKLGLSVKDKLGQGDALVAPVPNADGVFTSCSVYLNIPSVTVNSKNEKIWMRGEPRTYYSAKNSEQTSLLVVNELTDLWLTAQQIAEWNDWLNLLIICPTHSDNGNLPAAWHQIDFWRRFERVYIGYASNLTGNRLANEVAKLANRQTHRLRLPLGHGKSWQEFWNKGGTVEEFQHFLTESVAFGDLRAEGDHILQPLGQIRQDPVDIAYAFHNELLHYVIRKKTSQMLQGVKDGFGKSKIEITEKYVTEIIRSDRTVHTVRESPYPRGTPPSERVLRLSDGTLLESEPSVSRFATWSPDSVSSYLKSEFSYGSLDTILSEIKIILKQSVWLPYDYDYDLLTLLAAVTFAQPIFTSVPMIYLIGSSEEHRAALGNIMCAICNNAAYIADLAPGDTARRIHKARGFTFLNEFDFSGRGIKREYALFRELSHALRVSYNRDAGIKLWGDSVTGADAEKLNLFGVKMFGIPDGADQYPNSPMLRIVLHETPPELKARYARTSATTIKTLHQLRDQLHVWTFEKSRRIDREYRRIFFRPAEREADFTAPLKVFAELSGDTELRDGLFKALKVSRESVIDVSNPIELMIQAAKNLVCEGYSKVCATHVSLEMKAILGYELYQQLGGEQLWEDPAWVGRELRNFQIVDKGTFEQRGRLQRFYFRVFPLKNIINLYLEGNMFQNLNWPVKQPFDFCRECSDCRYRELNCPIQKMKMDSQTTFTENSRKRSRQPLK